MRIFLHTLGEASVPSHCSATGRFDVSDDDPHVRQSKTGIRPGGLAIPKHAADQSDGAAWASARFSHCTVYIRAFFTVYVTTFFTVYSVR